MKLKADVDIKEIKLEDLRPYLVPIGTFVIVIILSYITFNYFWNNVSKVRKDVNSVNREKNILDERLDVLRSNQIGLQESQEYVTTALPLINNSVLSFNQILNLAAENSISLTNISITEPRNIESKDGVLTVVTLGYTIEGSYSDVFNYISSIKNIAPLISIKDAEIKSKGTTFEAELSVDSYYSLPPESIPAITSPIDDLTDEENATISEIKDYSQPEFIRNVNIENVDVGKENPFE